MRNFLKISFLLCLGTHFACEGRRRDQAVCPPTETDLAQVAKSSVAEVQPLKKAAGEPAMALAAKVVPDAEKISESVQVVPEPVKYTEEATAGVFDNPASKEEAKNDDLQKIKEDAIRRLRTSSQKLASVQDIESPEAKAIEAAPEQKSAVPTESGEAASQSGSMEFVDASPEGKENLKSADGLYQRARTLTSQGKSKEARKLYLSACQAGHVESCHKFAWHQEQLGNRTNAVRFYKAACDRGLTKSCNNLAFHFEREKQWDMALDLYSKACMAKHKLSCAGIRRVNTLKSR